jgi:hypothetical protein
MDETMPDQPITSVGSTEGHDNPIERLELLAGDDDAISSFLDEIDVRSPREREMLGELARPSVIARPERFAADHRRALVALETLRRHGYQGSRAAGRLGPLKFVARWGIELVARWIVVSYVKSVATDMRNLYWFREMEAPDGSSEVKLIRPARMDAVATIEIVKGRALGVPAFVIGGLLIPVVAALYRLTTGFAFQSWIAAVVVGLIGVAVGLSISWIVLRGTAMANRRIRLTIREPLRTLWDSVGYCGNPPRNQARKFAIVAVSLTIAAWIVLPAVVGIALSH